MRHMPVTASATVAGVSCPIVLIQVPTTSDETVSIAAWPELNELFIKLYTPLPARAAE